MSIERELHVSTPYGFLGVRNTPIPQEKLANTEIPFRKLTKYRYRIYDRSHLLEVVSVSRVSQACIYTRNQPQPLQGNVRKIFQKFSNKLLNQGLQTNYMSYFLSE